MILTPKTGEPQAEGRYVAFIRCQAQGANEWVEPVIMTWQGGKWHTGMGQRRIVGWLGPLPVMKAMDIEVPEYDL